MADRPLVVSADQLLLEELQRIAAAAQVELELVCGRPGRAQWRAAPLVIVDSAEVAGLLESRLPRRSGVVVVGPPQPGPLPLQECIQLGVEHTLRVGEADEVLIGLLSDTVAGGPGNGQLVAVIGGCGGAGASVLATAIATVADGRGRRVLLADCDPWGPGLDVVLGIEDSGIHWRSLAAPTGRLSAADLHAALPTVPVGRGRISLLCHERTAIEPVDPDVAQVVVHSGRRAGDLMVADVPRTIDEAAERVLEAADLVLLVVTADVRGSYSGLRVARRLVGAGLAPELVVRGPSPGGIGADDIGLALELPVLTRMRPQPFLAQTMESGRLPGVDRRGPLAKAAGRVLDRLAEVG